MVRHAALALGGACSSAEPNEGPVVAVDGTETREEPRIVAQSGANPGSNFAMKGSTKLSANWSARVDQLVPLQAKAP